MRILSPLFKITDHPDENLNTDINKYIAAIKSHFFLMEIFIKQCSETTFGDIIWKQDLGSRYGETAMCDVLKGPWNNLFYTKQ